MLVYFTIICYFFVVTNVTNGVNMKNQYIRCPRCELNYIFKKDKFCNVCKMEMKALGTLGAEENTDLEICPICKTNYIGPDEEMCASCAREHEFDEEEVDKEEDGLWNNFTPLAENDSAYVDKEDDDELDTLEGLDDTGIADDDEDEETLDDEDEETLDDDDEDDFDEDEDDFEDDDDEE